MRDSTRVSVLFALALIGTANAAVFTFTANAATITITGGALLLNGAHTVLDWTNVVLDDATIDVTNLLSAKIDGSSFNNVAFTATTTGTSGDVPADAARQLWLQDNTFTFDGSSTFYQVGRDYAFKLAVEPFFLDPPAPGYPLHLNAFSIAVAQATPLGFAGVDDRTGNAGIDTPTADLVPPIGLWLEGRTTVVGVGATSNTAILANFVAPHGGSHCTTEDQSVVYALSQLNSLSYARVDPASPSPASADVRFNDAVCNGVGDCDLCPTDPIGTPPNVEVGRYVRVVLAFNPLTGKVDITAKVEDRNSDAVTISSDAFVNINTQGTCANRDSIIIADAAVHTIGPDGRFAAKNDWSVGAPYQIIENDVALNVRDYTMSLDMGALAACSGDLSTAAQMSVTFYVTHTALLDNTVVRIMGENAQQFNIFWFTQFIAAVGSSTNQLGVVNSGDFKLVTRAPVHNAPTDDIFEIEIYTPKAQTLIAQTLAGGLTTFSYNEVSGLTPCTISSGATSACETVLTLDITAGCRPDEGVYPNAQYCYQLITIHTDQPHLFVLLPTAFTIELRDTHGTGSILSQAQISTLLDMFISSTEIEGADEDLSVAVKVFAGGEDVHVDPALDKAQESNFAAGEQMCFKFTVEGFNHTNTRWDKFGIDLTYGVYCALDPANLAGVTDFPPYTFNQRQVTGCNAFIPAPVQRVKFMDAFSPTCRVPQTGTLTDQRYLCNDGNDLTAMDNQHILGTCDSTNAAEADKHCMITAETGGLSANLLGSDSCDLGPGNECSNGGVDHKTAEILGVPATWTEKQCRSTADLETIVSCQASTAGCSVPDECARPVHSVMACLDAPLLTFGPENTPAPITFNFDVLVHLTTSTGTISTRRRLLASTADAVRPSASDVAARKLLRAGTATDNAPTAAQVDNLKVSCPDGKVVVVENGKATCQDGVPGTAGTASTGTTGGASLRSVSGVRGASNINTLDSAAGTESAEAESAGTAVLHTSVIAGMMAALVVLLAGVGFYGRKRVRNMKAARAAFEAHASKTHDEIAAADAATP
jgi:hypothetical protein